MATIKEDYVSFETAKLLKDKGFDEPTIGTYNIESKNPILIERPIRAIHCEAIISAPTLQMAMKWLREGHNLFIDTYYDCDFGEGYKFSVHKLPKGTTLESHNESYSTYEKACDGAIKYCLEKLI